MTNLILFWVGIIFGFLSIAYGAWTSGRLEGKLKYAVIFMIVAVIAFMTKEIINTSDLSGISVAEFTIQGANIAIILFIFFSVFSIKQVIRAVNNKKY